MDSRRLSILVVDEDPGRRQSLAELATRAELDPSEAVSGLEALVKVQAHRPDLILADWDLPAWPGRRLLDSLRNEPTGYRPYVIALSAVTDEPAVARIIAAGAEDVIAKPALAPIVLARLRTAQRLLRLERINDRHLLQLQEYSEELNCSNLRLRELLAIDELTGLPNRRQALDAMRHAWSDASHRHSPLSCMSVEITGLGEINRTHGYERGDVVLKTLAAMLRSLASPGDVVCRIGGDEFLIICPGTPLAGLQASGRRLAATFEALTAEHPHCELRMGVAHYRPEVPTPQALINLAIEGKSHAKRYRLMRVVCMQENARSRTRDTTRPGRRAQNRLTENGVPTTGCLFAVV